MPAFKRTARAGAKTAIKLAAKPAAKPASRTRPTAPVRRPVLLVLAGVNGAGKSSIGGNVMLRRAGLAWFNPDTYTRLLVQSGLPLPEANAQAWRHGVDLLDRAIAAGHNHAFETTLGGQTMVRKIAAAAQTHDVCWSGFAACLHPNNTWHGWRRAWLQVATTSRRPRYASAG
jgi:Zeta toxin